MAAAADYGFTLLSHGPHSPDLAPSDFYFFPKLKSNLYGIVFIINDEVRYIGYVREYQDADLEHIAGASLDQLYWCQTICIPNEFVCEAKKLSIYPRILRVSFMK